MSPSTLPRTAPDLESPPVGPEDASIYVHFPYCGHKCPYCDFNSHVQVHDDVAYADAVIRELETRGKSLVSPPEGLSSVYFGGGTPSRWAPDQVGRVLTSITQRWGVRPGVEVTLEANPGTIDAQRFEEFRAAGINRFSIGCQSFCDRELKALGRTHDAASGRAAVKRAQATGARVSLDLIYGLHGQTESQARRSVDTAIELQPDHVSAYTLTIEPETVLARRVRLGLYKPMPDDAQADLIERVSQQLDAAGYLRYEVSSYARRGCVSLHNTLYWLGGSYLGVGAGAHSYLPSPGGRTAIRRENEKSPERYLFGALGLGVEPRFEERLGRNEVLADRLMVVFRTAFGLDERALSQEMGVPLASWPSLPRTLQQLTRQGLLRPHGSRVGPTSRGFLFNDAVARAMLEAAQSCPVENPDEATPPR